MSCRDNLEGDYYRKNLETNKKTVNTSKRLVMQNSSQSLLSRICGTRNHMFDRTFGDEYTVKHEHIACSP